MSASVCQEAECEGWAVAPEDHFCACCGASQSQLQITLETAPEDPGDWRPLPYSVVESRCTALVRLRIQHTGTSGLLELGPATLRGPSWLALEGISACTLAPGQELYCAIHQLDQPALIEEAEIVVDCPPCSQTVRLYYAPLATLRISPESPAVTLGEVPLEALLELEVTDGIAFLDAPPELAGEAAFPTFLDSRRALRYPVRVRLEGKPESLEVTFPRLYPGARLLRLSHPLRYENPALLTCAPFGPDGRANWNHLRGFSPSREFSVTLRNAPGRRSVQLDPPVLLDPPPWLRLQDWEPVCLEGGQDWSYPLTLGGEEFPDFQTLEIQVGGQAYYLDFSSRAASVYPGWLLIDFGTSTSVAAVLDENRAVELVPLEGDSHLLPSVVCYLAEGRVQIGLAALAGQDDARWQRATVRAAKRQLGDRSDLYSLVPLETPTLTLRLSAVEVVTDFLREFVRRTQDWLLDQGRQDILFRRVSVCHPARFSLRQMDALREACEAALRAQKGVPAQEPSWEILTLPEPLTAALEYLSQHTVPASANSVLVYDIGGGTVDLGLLRVSTQVLAGGTSVVRPILLGADGHRWFGGEDITAAVRDLVLAQSPTVWNDSWAEQVKLHLLDGRPLPVDFEGTLPTLADVQEAIRPRLLETVVQARKLCQLHDVPEPGVVLRVGLSSQFPIVEQVLREAFPGSVQVTTAQLKECVVLGAALHPLVARAGGVSLLRANHLHVDQDCIRPATTSRLGLKMAANPGSRFLEVVAAGTPVPAAGLVVPVVALALMGGQNCFTILENAGSDDQLPNPDIQVIRSFEMELPAPQGSPIWQGALLVFRVSAAMEISLEVTLPNQMPRSTATVSALEYGTVY